MPAQSTQTLSNRTNYKWRFFRAGGFDQVKLDTGADLMALNQLDQKLWVALACPTNGLHFDSRTLQLIDTDKDGRVRAPELISAVQWAGSLLRTIQSMPLRTSAACSDAQELGRWPRCPRNAAKSSRRDGDSGLPYRRLNEATRFRRAKLPRFTPASSRIRRGIGRS